MSHPHLNAILIYLVGYCYFNGVEPIFQHVRKNLAQAFSTEKRHHPKNARIMDTHIPIRLKREIG